ncbi:hypothetical protein ACQPXH_15690 [Nocardia sp. CA-135953]|uniref:hypothetical protein n=1 Tax=Nocardia sp. CA-135953 TaxID=3239978 RepID=UPI003D964BB5
MDSVPTRTGSRRSTPRDISAISRHSSGYFRASGRHGFSEDEITAVKKHVFETEHPILDYETNEILLQRFDANADMAEAWIRLRSGRALSEDYLLLEHELAELIYMSEIPGVTYQQAHRFIQEKFNWDKVRPSSRGEDFESDGKWQFCCM